MLKSILSAILMMASLTGPAHAGLNLGSTPLYLGAAVQPIVMLNLPRDHQLYVKAFNDFSDLDGDGTIDTQYKHTITYYGYFDAFKCYDYDTVNHRFNPFGLTADKYCTGANDGKWSGNFLNWTSMSRIDIIRKILYGGMRVSDTQTLTVLERTVIPTDIHAWSKYYDGGGAADDIRKLTPFTASSSPRTYPSASTKTVRTVTSINRVVRGVTSITRSGTTATVNATAHGFRANDQVVITGSSVANYNGIFVIATVAANSFTYTLPASVGATANNVGILAVSELAQVNSVAHGFTAGQSVTLSNADQPEYDGTFSVNTAAANSFTFYTPKLAAADSINAGISATLQSTTMTITNSGGVRNIIVGDQVLVTSTATPSITMSGTVTAATGVSITFNADQSTGGSGSTIGSWTVANMSSHGITICSVNDAGTASTNTEQLNTATYPPLIRVAQGNFGLWHVTDGRECRWSGGTNGNKVGFSELWASQNAPAQTTVAAGGVALGSGYGVGEFVVRVRVCDSALLGQEKCLNYPGNPVTSGGVWKPVGLLQDYSSGNNRKIRFGLFTGSYSKNLSGGVLRKNAGFLDTVLPGAAPAAGDEIDTRDGTFVAASNGIIKTLNALRLFGYDYAGGNYGSNSDSCNSPGLVSPGEGTCSSWGNPISEIYGETLRYLGGKAVNTAFTPTPPAAGVFSSGGLTKDNILGLRVQGWQDPVSNANYCAPLNVVVFNASVNSYDNDQVDISALAGAPAVKTYTKNLGIAENITSGNSYLIGDKGNSVAATAGPGGICTPKPFDQANVLGDVMGICPEAPALKGTYLLAGAAHYARTNRIRTDLTSVPGTDATSLKVNTYGISLNTATPKMVIPVPGTGALAIPPNSVPARFVTILPTGKTLNAGSYRGGGSITDFKVVRQNLANGTGKFFVSWEDSLQGNDFDLDTWGTIEYRFVNSNTQIQVTTQVVYAAAGFTLGFGFIISGTNGSDGEHFLSAHKGNTTFDYTAADGTVECTDCQASDGPRARTFNLAPGATATVLNDPLFYAAKYGGFKDLNGNNLPDQTSEWDILKSDGTAGTDGLPDNYFFVTNPSQLESAMDRTFIYILQVSSASSVATNSTSLNTGSRVYQARFNSNEWSGQMLSFNIDVNGVIDPAPLWDAGLRMPLATNRVVLTYSPGATAGTSASPAGIPFRWNSINAAQKAYMNLDGGSGVADTAGVECTADNVPVGCTIKGPLRLNWLRGDQSNEGATATRFRVRPTTVLGDTVNSTPRYIGPPSASYTDPNYITFKSNNASRTPMLYVGSNGGMLQAIEATTGASGGVERLAYVPFRLYPQLTKLTSKTYSHRYYVDGTPSVNDACLNSCSAVSDWRTVLVGGYNAGGQGYYALDVTDPANWSEANASSIVMWEFTDVNDPDLGYTYSKPIIAKMANGRWAAIFGNGYNSSVAESGETSCTGGAGTLVDPYTPAGCSVGRTGYGYLYVVFLDAGTDGVWTAGTDYIKISTNTSTDTATPATYTPGTPNGLATPVSVDTNGDGQVDYVYAGDLVGNLWKFDLTSATPSSWAVASGGVPLFVAQSAAGVRQPITTAPTLNPHSSSGMMVLFGTGKYLEQIDDTAPYSAATFYGIWDRLDGTTVTRSSLMEQKVLNVTAGNPTGKFTVSGKNVRLTSAYVPNYTESIRTNAAGTYADADTNPDAVAPTVTTPASQNGWLLDFPNSGNSTPPNNLIPGTGERVVFDPLISTSKLVFTTLIPSTVPCESGGTSFLMDLDPVTGSRLSNSPFDINNDSNFNSTDFVSYGGKTFAVSGMESTIGIVPQPTVIQATGREFKILSGSSGGLTAVSELSNASTPSAARTGRRISWRELLSN
jgi:type IV pilus assembly protein PilY1